MFNFIEKKKEQIFVKYFKYPFFITLISIFIYWLLPNNQIPISSKPTTFNTKQLQLEVHLESDDHLINSEKQYNDVDELQQKQEEIARLKEQEEEYFQTRIKTLPPGVPKPESNDIKEVKYFKKEEREVLTLINTVRIDPTSYVFQFLYPKAIQKNFFHSAKRVLPLIWSWDLQWKAYSAITSITTEDIERTESIASINNILNMINTLDMQYIIGFTRKNESTINLVNNWICELDEKSQMCIEDTSNAKTAIRKYIMSDDYKEVGIASMKVDSIPIHLFYPQLQFVPDLPLHQSVNNTNNEKHGGKYDDQNIETNTINKENDLNLKYAEGVMWVVILSKVSPTTQAANAIPSASAFLLPNNFAHPNYLTEKPSGNYTLLFLANYLTNGTIGRARAYIDDSGITIRVISHQTTPGTYTLAVDPQSVLLSSECISYYFVIANSDQQSVRYPHEGYYYLQNILHPELCSLDFEYVNRKEKNKNA